MSSSRLMRTLGAALLAALLVAAAPVVPDDEDGTDGWEPSPDRWAEPADATIFPSVYTVTEGSGCTSNFIFEWFEKLPDDTYKRHVYIGYAAHCAGLGTNTDTNGCLTGSEPLGTEVQIDGASRPGWLAYSSWQTMVARGQDPDSNPCRYNDLALVEIHPADHGRVNPSVPYFGGPTAVGGATSQGDEVYSMGNSGLRQGIEELKPKYELSLGTQNGGWIHRLYAVTPGIPGDSGSGHMDAAGRAIGVSSTIQAFPYAGSNGISDLGKALSYLRSTTSMRPELVAGTVTFDPQLP